MKKLILSPALFLFASLSIIIKPTPVFAQGTCPSSYPLSQCAITDPSPGNCIPNGFCDPVTGIAQYCCTTLIPPTTAPVSGGESSPLGGGICGSNKIDTAIGCIPLDESGLISFLLKWAIGIGGGIAFLLIAFAAFMIMTSQGDPKRLQAGQELLTSAIMGLILLVFSVFILRFIGVDLLNITELNG